MVKDLCLRSTGGSGQLRQAGIPIVWQQSFWTMRKSSIVRWIFYLVHQRKPINEGQTVQSTHRSSKPRRSWWNNFESISSTMEGRTCSGALECGKFKPRGDTRHHKGGFSMAVYFKIIIDSNRGVCTIFPPWFFIQGLCSFHLIPKPLCASHFLHSLIYLP